MSLLLKRSYNSLCVPFEAFQNNQSFFLVLCLSIYGRHFWMKSDNFAPIKLDIFKKSFINFTFNCLNLSITHQILLVQHAKDFFSGIFLDMIKAIFKWTFQFGHKFGVRLVIFHCESNAMHLNIWHFRVNCKFFQNGRNLGFLGHIENSLEFLIEMEMNQVVLLQVLICFFEPFEMFLGKKV